MPLIVALAVRVNSGSTTVEYSLIAGAIAMAIIGAVSLIGDSLLAWFQTLADAL